MKSPIDATVAFGFGPFTLLPAQRSLMQDGKAVRLGSRALELLIILAENAGEVVSKEELMRRVWPSSVVEEGGLRVHMAALRKALGEGQSGARYIANVPLRGYCLVAPVTVTQAPARNAVSLVGASSNLSPNAPEPRARIPSLLTRLIGRGEAIETLADALPQRRFVTLVGPGGMGKTTVALAAAESLADAYADGVRFVDLASLTDGNLIAPTVASVLGAPLHSGEALKDLLSWLSSKSVLIVLDNCEHIIGAAAALAEAILGASGAIHVLATSREPLRARGEWVQRLHSLESPPADPELTYDTAMRYAAFELFVERAMASLDGIVFSDADAVAIAKLCRALDGMPLAIELVAAQVSFFGLAALTANLNDSLSLPTVGRRTAMPRHQTLRATLEWSYRLLTPAEQRALRYLSVFRERFTLQAAISIVDDPDGNAAPILMELVSKSLVSADPGDDAVHYRLLETTRGYTAEHLLLDPERVAVRRRHANYCLATAQQASTELDVMVPARWRERNGRKIDDVRAALDWSFSDEGDVEIGLKLLAESPALWFGLWLVNEYMQRLGVALGRLPSHARGSRLEMQLAVEFGQASIAMKGGLIESLKVLENAANIARDLGDIQYELRALWACIGGYLLRGDYAISLDFTERLGTVARANENDSALLLYHRMKALCLHFQGEQASALQHARLALASSFRKLRGLEGNAYQFEHRTASLVQLARILWLTGHHAEASTTAAEAVATARAVDHALSLTYALAYAACPIALWNGDSEQSVRYVRELQECTDSHSLVFWQSWPRLYRYIIDLRSGTKTQPIDEATLQIGQIDMLATLQTVHIPAQASERNRQKINVWCASEVLRSEAEEMLRSSPSAIAGAEARLVEAIGLAKEQGAVSWQLRCATSLAQLFISTGRAGSALAELDEALAQFGDDEQSSDVEAARAVALALRTPRAAHVS